MKKPLIVTSIDFQKAFDSIKRHKLIESLIYFRVHPLIIDLIAKVCTEDKTYLQLNEEVRSEMAVTSGIKQGCTGSTTIFKLITYILIEQLNKTGVGYKDESFHINTLFYADDGLNLAQSVEDAQKSIEIITKLVGENGLQINQSKSNIIIYNMKERPREIAGIKVVNKIKYLGITVVDQKDCFKKQKEEILIKANNLANQIPSILAKSCHKMIIGKHFWKNVALSSILHGVNVIHFSKTDIEKLQRIENKVYRMILGAPAFTPVCVLRGEVGSSTMEARIMKGKLLYLSYILSKENSLIEIVFEELKFNHDKDYWIQEIKKTRNVMGLGQQNFKTLKKDEITKRYKFGMIKNGKENWQVKRA